MKSKLTLRLDEDLKERAKRLADERSTSVSKLVEDYFRILLGASTSGEEPSSSGREGPGPDSSEERRLSARVRTLKENLGEPAPAVTMDEDTRRWVDAAAEKHS